ncbi:uncharacterized protein METZ01_LOCUS372390, partial [marine metagenome]
ARERERLQTEISRLMVQVETARKKLSNEGFLRGAAADVVEKERSKESNFQEQLDKLRGKAATLGEF